MRILSILMIISFVIFSGFYVYSCNIGKQIAYSMELGTGNPIDYVENYVGQKIDMPKVAYGFVLGYAIKSLQGVQNENLPPYDDGYIWGFIDTWTQVKLIPESQAFANDLFGQGYDDGSSEACVMIYNNSDFNEYTKNYVKQVEDCL